MRRFLALIGSIGLLAVLAGDVRAQSADPLEELRGSASPNLLLGPGQGQDRSDETRKLSAPPSTDPVSGDDGARGREISPAERRELMQSPGGNPSEWLTGPNRN